MSKLHRFEQAGLGVAPFAFVKSIYKYYQASPDSPKQPGGMCEYCGNGIAECCVIRDSNNKQFIVGNECVKHTADKGIIDAAKVAVNKMRLQARHEKEQQTIDAGAELLKTSATLQNVLNTQPHPNSYRADKGDTLLDYVVFMFANAGAKGKLEACKVIDANKDKQVTSADLSALDAQRLQREADARQAEIVAQQQKDAENARKRQCEAENIDIIQVLTPASRNSPFVADMIGNLREQRLCYLSARQFAIVADIYSKTFGRSNSKNYNDAYESLEARYYVAKEVK